MKYVVAILSLVFALAAQAGNRGSCENLIATQYSSAIHELAKGYIELEKLVTEGRATTAIYNSIAGNLERSRLELLKMLGEDEFLRVLSQSLKAQSALDISESKTRTTRRQRSIVDESILGSFTEQYRLDSRKVILTKDGQRFLNRTENGKISMHDFGTGKELYELPPGTFGFDDSQLSADDSFVAVVSSDKTLSVWDANAGQSLYKKKVAANLFGVKLSPDGQLLAATEEHENIHLLKTIDGTQLKVLEQIKSGPVSTVEFSSDGHLLLALRGSLYMGLQSRQESFIRIWDTKTFKVLYDFESKLAVKSAAWEPGGQRVIVDQFGGTFSIWSPASNEKKIFENYFYPQWSHDGSYFVATKLGTTKLHVWKSSNLEKTVLQIDLDKIGVSRVEFSPDLTKIAGVCSDGHIRIWDLRSGLLVDYIQSGFESVQWSRSGNELIGINRLPPYQAIVMKPTSAVENE